MLRYRIVIFLIFRYHYGINASAPPPTFQSYLSTVSNAQCAKEHKRSMQCSGKGGPDKCCDGLVCHKHETWRCVQDQHKTCAGSLRYSVECGSTYKKASPKCCDGLTCLGKKCVDASTCSLENKRARQCGAIGGKDICCPGLVCHEYQKWRCVQEKNKQCSSEGTYSKQCGSRYQNSSPFCCDGLVCKDKKCVLPKDAPPPTLEEALLSDDLFGRSSTMCGNYIPEDGEYSFTFNLSELPYFDNSLSGVEKVMFQVQMSHTDANSNRTWSIKVGTGGNIYSMQGPYGESIPPNKKSGMQFVDEVNQKVAVDSIKNRDANGNGYFIHQAGVYQNGDSGYTNKMPFWFSPNVAIYCSTLVPECRMASWGQQSYVRPWTERVIYYDRYRDCGDGILERTHIVHNAEKPDTDTVLTYVNMPWGGTRYTTLKDFVFSQDHDAWDYDMYNLTGGIEDPMLIFGIDDSYGSNVNRVIPTPWTKGYTIFTQDLPFKETPSFSFPGRLPSLGYEPTLVATYGPANTNWICQGPLGGYSLPDVGNYRCRFAQPIANPTNDLKKGCFQCYLRLTNQNGDSFSVFNIRNWFNYDPTHKVYMMFFNSIETTEKIRSVITNGATITVSWDETGMREEDNLAYSFVHGRSENMVDNGRPYSKMKFGHANNVERDYAVYEYVSYPNLQFGDVFRARQYYITDQFTGLSDRSLALASDTIEEVIRAGEYAPSEIHLHYIDDGQSLTFGSTIDEYSCNSTKATTIACTGSTTPQIGMSAFLQIGCGSSTYVGTDFYHFSNFPNVPHRVMNCKVNGVTTSTRPSVKLLGYFSETKCGTVLQHRTYDANFC